MNRLDFFRLIAALFTAVTALSAAAADLESAEIRPNSRIGIYVGTFDPFHAGHASIVERAISEGNLDYVIVLPNDWTFHKPNATPFDLRLRPLHRLYAESKRVLVPTGLGKTRWIDQFLPMSALVTSRIRKACPTCTMYGIKGTDVATSVFKAFIDRVFMRWVRKWIFFERDDKSVALAKSKFTDPEKYRFIRAGHTEASSTRIREWLKAHPEFYDSPNAGTHFDFPPEFLPETRDAIRENHLFDPRVTIGHPLYSTPSFVPDSIEWKTGQLVGISSRAGRTPFIVQTATHSPIDHVGVVVVEPDGPYLYEFTNSNGVSKSSLMTAFDHARGKSGHLMAVVYEPKFPIPTNAAAKWGDFLERARVEQARVGIGKSADLPRSCTQLVRSLYAEIGQAVGESRGIEAFDTGAFDGFIGQNWRDILLDDKTLIAPRDLFDSRFSRIAGNMPADLGWSPSSVLQTWKDDGDLTKLARGLAAKEKVYLRTPADVEKATRRLVDLLEGTLEKSLNDRCVHWLLPPSALESL